MTSYPLNLAESYALVRLDSDKPDNLHPDGNYHECAICSVYHDKCKLTFAVEQLASRNNYLPSVTVLSIMTLQN